MSEVMTENWIEIKNLKKYFQVGKQTVKAVDDVSFSVPRGQTFGIVGESGCGKSTLGKALLRLSEPTAGDILIQGQSFLTLKGAALRQARRQMQMIFQDPYSSLNPRMNIGQILAEPFDIQKISNSKERQLKIKNLVELVGLKETDLRRYPHEFSGGQKQRICIARAIALEPELVICDEPVSALDVSIQAQILNMLKELQERFHLTYIFISHDLSVIEHFCDQVAVMYLGKIVELKSRQELFENPEHPYTQALLAAAPQMGQGKQQMKKALQGELPSPLNPPTGCYFHPRCPQVLSRCQNQAPPFANGVACWLKG